MIRRAAKQQFYNTSKFDFAKLLADPEGLAQNLLHYIQAFSAETRALFAHFAFDQQIQKLDKSNRLFKLVQKFSEVDLHPNVVSNLEIGRSFEELVRKFNEAANEEAGDHFTPREVIRLWSTSSSCPITTSSAEKTRSAPSSTRRPELAACFPKPPNTCASLTRTPSSCSSARTTTLRPTPSAAPTCSSRARRSTTSSTAVRPSSPAMPAPAKATSGSGLSRTTGWKASSPCPTSSSITPASILTSGS